LDYVLLLSSYEGANFAKIITLQLMCTLVNSLWTEMLYVAFLICCAENTKAWHVYRPACELVIGLKISTDVATVSVVN